MAQIMCAFNASGCADERLILLSQWLDEHTSGAVLGIEPASEDASFRRYFRVALKHTTLIVMDAPPEQEPVAPFVAIAGRIRSVGVEAPQVYAVDAERGFVLLSDLGNETYLSHLDGGGDADRLYGDAIDVLVTMQTRLSTAGLEVYDAPLLAREMAIFRDWLVGRHLGIEFSRADEEAWRATLDYLTATALQQPRVFVHRDYHSRNLMAGRPGAPGVLDFQDAVAGPVTYDLVSLLKDCYISWPSGRVAGWVAIYRDLISQTQLGPRLAHLDDNEWLRVFDAMGVQRQLKASGIFARLWHRDGKPGYLGDVPRTLGYVTSCRDADGRLGWLSALISERVLPAFARTPT